MRNEPSQLCFASLHCADLSEASIQGMAQKHLGCVVMLR